ncbi:E3 ubiquitin-protein ligase TRIM71, partial [Geodia barretti]
FVSANKPTLSYTLSHPSFSSFPLSLTLSPLSSLSLLSLPPLSLPRRLVKRAIGLAGSPSGLFSMPIGITANSKDELFIADRQACKITKLAPDGRVVGSYGRQGRGSGGLRHPESVAVTTDRLFVVDTGNNCIQAMSLKSGKFKVIGGRGVPDGIQLREPQGVAVDEVRGRLYITDAGYNCLLCVSLATLEPSLPSGRAGTVL